MYIFSHWHPHWRCEFQLQGCLERSLKWLLINYQILLPNFLVLSCEWLGEFYIASKVTSSKGLIPHTPSICLNFGFQSQLNKKCQKSKSSKIRGIPKLDDANDAGGRNSSQCTLILTEGDSAKTLAVSGLSVVGKDHYGVFPLRGKLLNVRDASHKQVQDFRV